MTVTRKIGLAMAVIVVAGLFASGIGALVLSHRATEAAQVIRDISASAAFVGRDPDRVAAQVKVMAAEMEAHGYADPLSAVRLAAAIESCWSLTIAEKRKLAAASPAIVAAHYGGDWGAAISAFSVRSDNLVYRARLPKEWRLFLVRMGPPAQKTPAASSTPTVIHSNDVESRLRVSIEATTSAETAREARAKALKAAQKGREQGRLVQKGYGVLVGRNGERYEGEIRGGKRDGYGVAIYSNGDRYEGKYQRDQKSGSGVYLYANGDRYMGDFASNQINGAGIYFHADGRRYEGLFAAGQAKGPGILLPSDGADGPFGVVMGSPIQKYKSCNPSLIPGYYFCNILPRPNSDLSTYHIEAWPGIGVCLVAGWSRAIETDPAGKELRSEVDKIASEIAEIYGSTEAIHSLTPGSIWTGSQNWMMGILTHQRSYEYYWAADMGDPLLHGISSISVSAAALSHNPNSGFVVVIFAFRNLPDCKKAERSANAKTF